MKHIYDFPTCNLEFWNEKNDLYLENEFVHFFNRFWACFCLWLSSIALIDSTHAFSLLRMTYAWLDMLWIWLCLCKGKLVDMLLGFHAFANRFWLSTCFTVCAPFSVHYWWVDLASRTTAHIYWSLAHELVPPPCENVS